MITLFHGDDTFESFVAAEKEFKSRTKKTGFEPKRLNLDEMNSPDQLLAEVEGVGMFAADSIIFGKRPYSSKVILDFLAKNFENMNEYEFILWEDRKADGKRSLTKKLKKAKQTKEFTLPKEWQMSGWVEKIAKAKKVTVNKLTVNMLIERYGTNKWQILNEITKLKLYVDATGNMPDEKEVSRVLGFDVNGDIWKFLDAFGNKKRNEMFEEFEKLTQFEPQTQYFIAMLHRELQLMHDVKVVEKSSGDYKSLRMHPFVLKKTIAKAKNFSLDEIAQKMRKLLQLDLSIKSGSIDERVGLEMWLMD